jgi:hypothetical protein
MYVMMDHFDNIVIGRVKDEQKLKEVIGLTSNDSDDFFIESCTIKLSIMNKENRQQDSLEEFLSIAISRHDWTSDDLVNAAEEQEAVCLRLELAHYISENWFPIMNIFKGGKDKIYELEGKKETIKDNLSEMMKTLETLMKCNQEVVKYQDFDPSTQICIGAYSKTGKDISFTYWPGSNGENLEEITRKHIAGIFLASNVLHDKSINRIYMSYTESNRSLNYHTDYSQLKLRVVQIGKQFPLANYPASLQNLINFAKSTDNPIENLWTLLRDKYHREED